MADACDNLDLLCGLFRWMDRLVSDFGLETPLSSGQWAIFQRLFQPYLDDLPYERVIEMWKATRGDRPNKCPTCGSEFFAYCGYCFWKAGQDRIWEDPAADR